MSFFSKILKKKPGGTLLGNILRKVASAFTGGILGEGNFGYGGFGAAPRIDSDDENTDDRGSFFKLFS